MRKVTRTVCSILMGLPAKETTAKGRTVSLAA